MTIVASISALALDRRGAIAAASDVHAIVDRHAAAIALLLSASAAGVGVAHGTYAASGSDASGYVSQAALIASGALSRDEPLARQVGWPDAEWAFSPLGYRPGPRAGELVPTYPPGLPLVMACARTLGDTWSVYLVVPLLGGMAVWCTYLLGARLHSGTAGLIAAALLTASPIFLFQIVQPMSDVAVTSWWTLAIVLALRPTRASAVGAGCAAGLALLTRPNLVPLGAVVFVLTLNGRQSAWFVLGIAPAIATVALLQWRLYGSPVATGYGSAGDLFTIANIGPNLLDYAQRVLTGEPATLVLAVASLIVAWRARAETHRLRSVALLAASVFSIVLACYLPYGVFADWWYLRFLLPAFPCLFVLVGALATIALRRVPAPVRGAALITVLAVHMSTHATVARREQAFNLARYEGRYRTAGAYLASTLPSRAVVITAQESGSVGYYADRPIVRWDLLATDLDAAVASLRAIGRYPVLLVEDWERPRLSARFPASQIARLDWRPRAEVAAVTRVWLFDPADRGVAIQIWPTDRLR